MRRHVLMLVLVGLVFAPSAHARGTFVLAADSSGDPGYIGIGVVASEGVTNVAIGERIKGEDVKFVDVEIEPFGAAAPGLAYGFVRRVARWECDRLERHFNARATDTDGTTITTGVWNRTPSCRNRLQVSAPVRVKPRSTATVKVRDRFRTGAVDGRVCLTAPTGRDTCNPLELPDGTKRSSTSFTPRAKGHYTLTVRTKEQRVRRHLAVGVAPRPEPELPVVLATGDSQMQSLDAVLGDDLTKRAWLESDVHNGSGLIQDDPVDWDTLPGQQVGQFAADATVIALGANDAGRMTTPDGDQVTCCGANWIYEYARRVEHTMRAYAARGGHVFWLTTPASRDAQRTEAAAAVHKAVAGAAEQVPRSEVVDMAAIFTPNGVFQNKIVWKGEKVDVRATDGVHLSIDGSEIASEIIIERLEKAGVLSGGTQAPQARGGDRRR